MLEEEGRLGAVEVGDVGLVRQDVAFAFVAPASASILARFSAEARRMKASRPHKPPFQWFSVMFTSDPDHAPLDCPQCPAAAI